MQKHVNPIWSRHPPTLASASASLWVCGIFCVIIRSNFDECFTSVWFERPVDINCSRNKRTSQRYKYIFFLLFPSTQDISRRQRLTRRGPKMKVRSKKSYINLDEYDSRVALYSEEEFSHGISFSCVKVWTGPERYSLCGSLYLCHEWCSGRCSECITICPPGPLEYSFTQRCPLSFTSSCTSSCTSSLLCNTWLTYPSEALFALFRLSNCKRQPSVSQVTLNSLGCAWLEFFFSLSLPLPMVPWLVTLAIVETETLKPSPLCVCLRVSRCPSSPKSTSVHLSSVHWLVRGS